VSTSNNVTTSSTTTLAPTIVDAQALVDTQLRNERERGDAASPHAAVDVLYESD
jgi:hypothetical protein